MYSVLNALSEYTYFYISKNITLYTFLLDFKIVESLQCILKTKMPLTVLNCYTIVTVLNCHTILIKNVCRLLCKSMLPTMLINLCVKLKHLHLASYVGVEKLTSKINAALR